MYKILDEMVKQSFPTMDIFKDFKDKSIEESMPQMNEMAKLILNENLNLKTFVEWSLWGNQNDLSLSFKSKVKLRNGGGENELGNMIIVNHMDLVLNQLVRSKEVIIVLDNGGIELFADLCLARELTKKHGTKIIFYGKLIPWFVSDVTRTDFYQFVNVTSNKYDKELEFKEILKDFHSYLEQGVWKYLDHEFFTLPDPFWYLGRDSPDLLQEFERVDFIIFKGDLNYRKVR